jgi:hypothetical protein
MNDQRTLRSRNTRSQFRPELLQTFNPEEKNLP